MGILHEFQTIGVLNVESDWVQFTVFSLEDGQELSTTTRRLYLIKDGRKYDRNVCDDEQRRQRREAAASAPKSSVSGHVEQDPVAIWTAVQLVIIEGVDNLCRIGMPVMFIKALAVTNEMCTLMAWNADTGKPLHNAVHWTDSRMGGRGCTAAAAEWLYKRSAAVACAETACRMGTLDAWLVWKLTAGEIYETDVTNASFTGLLDLTTLDWDRDLMRERGLPEHAWPAVRSPYHSGKSSVVVVLVGRLHGVCVETTMTRPSAALYGHLFAASSTDVPRPRDRPYECSRSVPGHVSVTFAHGSVVAMGVIAGPPSRKPSANDPTPVIAYCVRHPVNPRKPDKVVYASVTMSTAPEVICWLRDNVRLVKSVDECMNVYSSARPDGGGRRLPSVVPAVNGLPYAPYSRDDACLVVHGLTENMDSKHLIVATVDSLCYTVADMARCVAPKVRAVFVDGEYGRYDTLLVRLADACGCRVLRRRNDMTGTGAARLAASTIHTSYKDAFEAMEFLPTCTPDEHEFAAKQWANALHRSFGWFRATDPEPDRYDLGLLHENENDSEGYFSRFTNFIVTCITEVLFFFKTF